LLKVASTDHLVPFEVEEELADLLDRRRVRDQDAVSHPSHSSVSQSAFEADEQLVDLTGLRAPIGHPGFARFIGAISEESVHPITSAAPAASRSWSPRALLRAH